VIAGGDGVDVIDGAGGDDRLCGDTGNDAITGRTGGDQLLGGFDDDDLFARDGIADVVDCGLGTDSAQTDQLSLDSVTGCETLHALPEPPPGTTIVDGRQTQLRLRRPQTHSALIAQEAEEGEEGPRQAVRSASSVRKLRRLGC
jgi:hypothetical protein